MRASRWIAAASVAVLLLGACGSDDKAADSTVAGTVASTVASTVDSAASDSTTASTTAASTGGSGTTGTGSEPTTGTLPSEINLTAVIDLTGPAGLAGTSVHDGIEFGLDEINSSGFLGDTKLTVEYLDTQTNKEQAVSLMSQTAKGDTPVVFGPVASSEALAVAPIAQSAGLPYVATQSQSAGVVETGDYVYRLTAPQSTFQNRTAEYLQSKGVKSAALVYLEDGVANSAWGKDIMPAELGKVDIDVADTASVATTDTDFSALVTRLIQESPDAIGISVIGAQNSTLVSQLRQQGYDGIIFGDLGFAGGTLDGAAEDANGVVYASDFAPFLDNASSKAFTDAWTQAKGSAPGTMNAEGYDAVWFVARAINEAQSVDRTAIRDAMAKVAAAGFDGAVGSITFDGRDERAAGAVGQLQDGQFVPVEP